MRYIWDNDLHIHSNLSTCSRDPEQTPDRILQYAKENNLKTIVLTDHCWNHSAMLSEAWRNEQDPLHARLVHWYRPQDLSHVRQALPLPQTDGIEFLFGVEAEMHKTGLVGMNREDFDALDFIVISTTHFHMRGFTISEEDASSPAGRANAWLHRLDTLFAMDLPFQKIGLAHLTCGHIAPDRNEFLQVLNLLPSDRLAEVFCKAAELGVGIELNSGDMKFAPEEAETVLRIYRIAKEQGCKFYMGSDAHHPSNFEKVKEIYERAIDMLELKEDDKFCIHK